MFCANCGYEITDGSLVCKRCGQKIGEPTPPYRNVVKKDVPVVQNLSIKKEYLVIIIILLVVMLVLGFMFFMDAEYDIPMPWDEFLNKRMFLYDLKNNL